MAPVGAQSKVDKGKEEFKRFEEGLVERHRGEMKRELARKLEEMEMGRMGIWKVVQERGKKERQRVEEQRQKVFELGEIPQAEKPKKKAVVIEIDGTMVASREVTEVEEVRGKRKMEVKLGVAFMGTKPVSQNRRQTRERMIYGEAASAEEFGERWYGECLRHGIEPESDIHLIGDGAAWIRTLQRTIHLGSRYSSPIPQKSEKIPLRVSGPFLSSIA